MVQIQNYKGADKDRNPYNHMALDGFACINQEYLLEQIRATTAIAVHLAIPLAGND